MGRDRLSRRLVRRGKSPLAARLIAVADAIDRTSLEEVEAQAGTAFDPEIARLAIQVLR